MKFVTFQPDKKNPIDRNYDFKDPYYDYLGFNPMYCTYAGILKSAVIGSLFAEISLPEDVLFIRADEFWLIDKKVHEKNIQGDFSIKSLPGPKDYFIKEVDNLNDFLDDMYLNFEILVNPKNIKIVNRINIKNRIEKAFEESNTNYKDISVEDINSIYIDYKELCIKKYKNVPTEDFIKRFAEARYYYNCYALLNDFFIDDFKDTFGLKISEDDLTMDKLHGSEDLFYNFKNKFWDNPSEKTFNSYKIFMERSLIIKS